MKLLGNRFLMMILKILMAFAIDIGTPQARLAQDAIDQIRARLIERDSPEMIDFFSFSFWQPRWLGTKKQFMSYVACIAGLFKGEHFFEDNILDETAEILMREIKIDIAPHSDFRELRLCTSGWETKEDIVNVLSEIQQDMLVRTVVSDGSIGKSAETQYEENIVNMRCDYLITRLKFDIDYKRFHYLLKAAERLNQPSI